MSRACGFQLLLLLPALLLPFSATAGEGSGIGWEGDFESGMQRAALEGRPVLFAINALEGEAANNALAQQIYRSAAWGEATREMVCFPCNPNTHGDGSSCTRYEGIPCRAHKDALNYVIRRFGADLISPQHIVLEPDGGLAFRKEYYERVVRPALLDELWVRISPELAYERAGDLRGDKIDALDQAETKDLTEAARAWLRSDDPLAAACILRAIDFTFDDDRKLALIFALDQTPRSQLPVVDLLADEAGARAADMPKQALALAKALLAVDRPMGVRLIARIAARCENPTLRRQALALWTAEGPEEKAAYAEVLLLTGDRPARAPSSGVSKAMEQRLLRAQHKAGRRKTSGATLKDALEDERPGPLFTALLEATPSEVVKHTTAVRTLFREAPFRLRAAAAVAMLGARLAAGGRLAPALYEAVTDPLEGPELRAAAVKHLGEDPGWNEEVWTEAVAKKLGGGR